MTRTEAYKRIEQLEHTNKEISCRRTKEGVEYELKVLEALGLIKFEEEKQPRTCAAFKLEDYPNGLDIIVGGNVIFKS